MVYVDANVFAFASAGEAAFAETVNSQRILSKIANNELSASTSALTWDEVVWACKKDLPFKEALVKGNAILIFPNLAVLDASLAVVRMAAELAAIYNLKPRDAIHAATAILNGEREIITDDADFDRVKELKRVTLAEASR